MRAETGPRESTAGALPFLAGSALLGTIGVFVHEAGADPLSATWFRCAFGLLGLTGWLAWRRQLPALRLARASVGWVLAAGVLLVAGWGLFFAAIERTSAGLAVVLFQLQPFWVIALGAWWLGERIGRRRLAAMGVAMAGLVLATGLVGPVLAADGPGAASAADLAGGVAACLVGALCTAAVTLIARHLGTVQALPTGALAWWQCAVGAATLWLFPLQQGWPAPGPAWAWLAGLGLVHTGLAYSLMYAGMARLSTERIAALQFAYPAVAIVVDALYFGHRLSAVQGIGVGLIAAALWAAERPASRRHGHRDGATARASRAATCAVTPGSRRQP